MCCEVKCVLLVIEMWVCGIFKYMIRGRFFVFCWVLEFYKVGILMSVGVFCNIFGRLGIELC